MTAPTIPGLNSLLLRWPARRQTDEAARSLLKAALTGPLTVEQAYQFQVELERSRSLVRDSDPVRPVLCDPMLDALFLDPAEFREYAAMIDQPTDNPDADIDDLVAELGQMYTDDPDRGTETENAYYSAADRTNAIGRELHARGGLVAMKRAHDAVLAEHGAGAASMLRVQWTNAGVCGWSVGWTLPAA